MRFRSFPDEAAWIAAALESLEPGRAPATGSAGIDSAEALPLELLLAGGGSPEPLYRALARLPLPAGGAALWLADERVVPAADPARNGAMIARALAGSPWASGLRLWPEGSAAAAAAAYAAELAAHFGGRPPRFDLAFLGIGTDGHAASLFPGDPILGEESALAAASLAPTPPRERMSLSLPALAGIRQLRFLLRGPEKRPILARLDRGVEDLPALRLVRRVEARGGEVELLYCEAPA